MLKKVFFSEKKVVGFLFNVITDTEDYLGIYD